MLRKYLFTLLIALSITLVISFTGISPANSSEVKKVENFSLKDYNGKTHQLKDYKNAKAIVLMFIATECPVSNAYNKRMAELHKKYKDKDVVFLGINSNNTEPIDDVKEHAKENGFGFAVLKDPKNVIADKLNATVTPEIYVLNSEFTVLYHGRIDDSRKEDNVKIKDLENALNEILNGKKVSISRTSAFGCTIKRAAS
jgi:peroxiredoxin